MNKAFKKGHQPLALYSRFNEIYLGNPDIQVMHIPGGAGHVELFQKMRNLMVLISLDAQHDCECRRQPLVQPQ